MFNFEVFPCGVKCAISTLLSNRGNLVNRWSLVEEAIRYLNLLEIIHEKEIMHQQILAMGLICVGEKKYKPETLIHTLSTLHYLEVLIAECENIMTYLKPQH